MLSRRAVLAAGFAPILGAQDRKATMFRNAEAYERFMGRWSSLLAPIFVNFANIPDDGNVLDIGSGTGALAYSIRTRHPRCTVTGIDPSNEYVSFARTRGENSSAQITFETGDAQQLRFANATFQAVLSLLVLNFIPDRRKALSEIVRVTKPGGIVSAAVWDYSQGMEMLRIFWDACVAIHPAAEQLDEKHMPLCRKGELGELWRSAGLLRIEELPLTITLPFTSFADYWEPFLLGQGPAGAYVQSLDTPHRDALRDEVRRRLRLASTERRFSIKARAWAVRGIAPPMHATLNSACLFSV